MGVVLCRWRAARRRTGRHHKALVPTLASDGGAEGMAVLCGIYFPTRRVKVKTEEVPRTTATDSDEADARNEALFVAELFALAMPNV